jgi:protein-S-isoprenylcysteine O-methyltransferase Ste14
MGRLTAVLERGFVWLGGAVFVLSLAVCAYVYVVVWQETRPVGRDLWRALATNVALFGVFAAHHSLFARARVKAALSRIIADRLLRSAYVWIASVLFIVLLACWQPVGGSVHRISGWAALPVMIVQLTGLVLIAASVRVIDPLELAGIRQRAVAEALQVVGPYRLVRHPLYLGWMLVVFGAPHMTGDRLAFAALSSLYLVIAIPWEERSLLAAFGDAYARYCERVRWRVIPHVY